MAIGDVVSDNQSIASAGYLSIQPASGIEWVINNIFYEADVTIEVYDGTNSIIFATKTSGGALLFLQLRCTNAKYIRVKNTNAVAKRIGYDGMITK